eukprot:930859-Rhodomonas_salina.1
MENDSTTPATEHKTTDSGESELVGEASEEANKRAEQKRSEKIGEERREESVASEGASEEKKGKQRAETGKGESDRKREREEGGEGENIPPQPSAPSGLLVTGRGVPVHCCPEALEHVNVIMQQDISNSEGPGSSSRGRRRTCAGPP